MKNQIDFIVQEVNRKSSNQLVILMTSTHGMTDTNLCKTEHEIYNLSAPNFPIKWPHDLPVPSNMHIIKSIDELPHRPDIVLSQNIIDQLNHFAGLAKFFDAPLVEFEHTLPTEEWVKGGVVKNLREQLSPDAYVFISEFSRKEWMRDDDKNSSVIYHMVDTEKYSGWEGGNKRCMMLVNAFKGREWAVGNPVPLMLKNEKIDLFGHNPGFTSKSLSREQVIQTMREYDVFLNTSVRSPIPASLLEAAAVGMPIVSRRTCAIPEFFKDHESILFYDTEEEALEKVNMLLAAKETRKVLGQNARKVVLEHFNEERYCDDWNQILYTALRNYNHDKC